MIGRRCPGAENGRSELCRSGRQVEVQSPVRRSRWTDVGDSVVAGDVEEGIDGAAVLVG